ncbi:DUF4142 domain-containing protein [Telluribacter sp. SYSU D00476]|uniref:DUF4142 domain-containing protein n=1 Tax=Telluribacter sp. SYSU D00476 TaxID=2811430 RepID=UPI001FF5CD67|nr:DUF4142 domain-containing protein [Telluribacter sp. SYSU D00476]
MKKSITYILVWVGLATAFSCTPMDANVVTATDRQFVESAVQRNQLDMQIGQVARTRATTDEVRRFGEILLRNGNTISEELRAMIEKKSLTLPDLEALTSKPEVDQLLSTPEATFNVNFLSTIIDSRKVTLELFEQQVRKGKDNELRSWASSKLPLLRQELERAQTIRATMK